jgi:tetratricopeptide (TPR) repeat protein
VLFAVLTVGGGCYLAHYLTRTPDWEIALDEANGKPPRESLAILQAALDRDPNNPRLLEAVANAIKRDQGPVNDYDHIITRWCQAEQNNPTPFRIKLELMQSVQRWDSAIEPARHLSSLVPKDASVHLALADLYYRTGRYEEAESEYDRVANLAGGLTDESILGLARTEIALKRPAEAIERLNHLLAKDPDNMSALLLRGVAHYEAGAFQQSIKDLERPEPRSFQDMELRLSTLGKALARNGQRAEAQAVFDKLARTQDAMAYHRDAQLTPDNRGLQIKAAQALLAADLKQDACNLLQSALAHLEPDRTMLEMLATCQEELGHPETAAELRRRAARFP